MSGLAAHPLAGRRVARSLDSAATARADVVIDPNAVPDPAGSSPLYNLLTGTGVAGSDSAVYNRWRSPRRLTVREVDAIRVDQIGDRLVTIPGREATREGWRVVAPRSKLPAEVTARVLRYLQARGDSLDLRGVMARWDACRAAWGWGLMHPGPLAPIEAWGVPLRAEDPIDLKWITIWERRGDEVQVGDYNPPEEAEFRRPAWYRLTRALSRPEVPDDERDGLGVLSTLLQTRLDESRCRRLSTPTGRSRLDGIAERFAELLAASRGAANVAGRPAIPWIKANTMGAQLRANAQRAKQTYHEAWQEAGDDAPMLLDSTESVGFAAPPGSGASASEPIFSLGYLLSAASGIPMTLLFGQSPGGFSGGDSEDRNWNNYVRTIQRELEPGLMWVYRLLLRELAGKISDPVLARQVRELDVGIVWEPLRVLSATEQAEYRKEAADYFETMRDIGALTPEEIRQGAVGGGTFSLDVPLIVRSQEEVERGAALPVGSVQAALAVLTTYYGTEIPPEAARAFMEAIDPSLAARAAVLIQNRTPEQIAAAAALAGAAAPPAAAPALPVQDEVPPDQPTTWRTAREIASELGTSPGYVRRLAGAGAVARRRGTGKGGATQYRLEDVREALAALEVPRVEPGDEQDEAEEKSTEGT